MPCFFRRSALASDAATAPSILFFIFANASINMKTVDPDPTPTTASSTTCLSAASATCRFSSSCVISSGSLPSLRRQVGADAFEELGRHADRLAHGRVRVDGLADVGRVGAHFHGKRELADQVARARTDDAAAHDAVRSGIENKLGETLVARVGDGAPRRGPGKLGDTDLLA